MRVATPGNDGNGVAYQAFALFPAMLPTAAAMATR
jgi:hypothetical protein